jgi:outer membrane protein TolC
MPQEKNTSLEKVKNKPMNTSTVYILISILFAVQLKGQSLDDYLVMSAENNPALKAQFNRYQAALERVPQIASLPDPQLTFGFFITPMELYMGNQVAEFSLMQMFPWFGTLGAAKNEAALMAKAKYETFNETKSMLYYEVKATWNALFLLKSEIDITIENIELLETMEQIALSRLKSGDNKTSSPLNNRAKETGKGSVKGSDGGMNMQPSSPGNNTQGMSSMSTMNKMDNMGGNSSGMIDVLRVQMEINELKNTLSLLQDSKVSLIAQFNKLLNRSLGEPVNLPVEIDEARMPEPVAAIPDSIRNNNPMLKMLEQEEASILAQEKMKRKMSFPMIGVGLQYGIFNARPNSESMMNGRNMVMPMATITIPLWRKKYSASVREAGFMRQSVIEQKEDLGNQLMVDYEEALKDFRDAQRRFRLYTVQTELAQQTLDILIAQYTTTGSNFEEVIRMQQKLLDYRLQKSDALADGNIASAMLERLMGR